MNMVLENKGVRTIVVRGDATREPESRWSFVSVIPMTAEPFYENTNHMRWRSVDEVGVLLGEQGTFPGPCGKNLLLG